MKKFFNTVIVVILIAVIAGGVGYIGYSSLFMNHSGHSTNSAASNTQKTDTSTDTMSPDMNMSQNTNNNNNIGLTQANLILQNKESLDKSIATLNEALKLMTVDPYASTAIVPSTHATASPTEIKSTNIQLSGVQGSNGTTVNIYPPSTSVTPAPDSMQPTVVMPSMGTTYDPNKMEQLHNGLYKISVGMALLDQLETQLVSQAQNSSSNTQDPVQYYTNQYYLTVQNKDKLTQALTYINEASNLININPYVSSNGLIYDKDRMTQVHQSVFKLAQGVVSLNVLNDEFTRQTVTLPNTVQNYINNANMSSMNMSTNSGFLGGILGNLNLTSVINIILILFVAGLILGILGFILSLLKPTPCRNTEEVSSESGA